MHNQLLSLFSLFFLFFSGAQALTLFVQTPTAAGAPALVVWTRDTAADGVGELRFDLRFVSTGNTTSSTNTTTSSTNTTATAASTTPAAPTATAASGSDNSTQENNTFVVQARAVGDSSDAGLALANIRLLAGVNAGSSNVFFPASGSYLVMAVSGPDNTPIGTSNSITVTDTTAAAAVSAAATPSSSAPTPTTAPALTTISPTSTPTSTSTTNATAGPISAAAAPSTKKHPNLGAIIGGVLGALVGLALLATLVFLVGRRRQLREKRRLTFHREWMVQSSESVRNLNLSRAGGAGSDDGHEGGASVSRNASVGSNASAGMAGRVRANSNAMTNVNMNTAGLLVPPSPFICVTPPPEDNMTDLETGLARNTVASRAPKKLRLHMYTNDTDVPTSPTATTSNNDGTKTLPAGAAPPAMYTPTMLANARNVASAITPTQPTMTMAMPTPMRQTSTTPVTALARMSSIHAHPGASPMGPRAPSPSPAAAAVPTTPTSPFPPQLPPLNLLTSTLDTAEGGMEAGRKPPASAPARSVTFPVKTVTVRTEASVGRTTTTTAGVINTLATRPASPRLPAAAPTPTPTAGPSSSAMPTPVIAAPTPVRATSSTAANRKTPRQHLLAARLNILQNQMAEILSAPDSVHSNLVLADMRRQVAWLLEQEQGEWALGRTDERPAGWARVMTP